MTRERAEEPDSAMIWSGPRMLSAPKVADHVVNLLDSNRLVEVIPRWRGWVARGTAMAGRPALRVSGLIGRRGERRRARR